jgi:hypothetical protein
MILGITQNNGPVIAIETHLRLWAAVVDFRYLEVQSRKRQAALVYVILFFFKCSALFAYMIG